MNKYRVLVAMTYWCDVEVEAVSKDFAEVLALDSFEIGNARQGEGEIYNVELIGETS